MFESVTGWDPHEVSPFRTGKSPVTFKRGAGTEARPLRVKQLSGWQGHVRAGVDHLFKKFAHERRGELIKKHQGTRSLGCVTAPWASEDSACNMPGASTST